LKGTGGALVLAFALIAAGVWAGLWGQDWAAANGGRWEPPGPEHWLGTNVLGQDILARTLQSTLTAFEIGVGVTALSTLIGAALGALSGWYAGTWTDDLLLWVKGVIDSIPFYLFVAALAFAMQGNAWSMHIAMVATFWTATGRLVRAEVMRLKQREFVQSAMAIGLPAPLILLRHVLPSTAHILLIQAAITFVATIKAEVLLSFLGLGGDRSVSWGLMLAESTQDVVAGQFANFLAASIPLFALLLGVNLLADRFSQSLNPVRRGATPA
jgi:peptide/nickel transport system permease protein